MILGRPTALWLGLATAAIGFVSLITEQVGYPIPSPILAALTLLVGAIVTFVAGQPPSINVGDPYTVVTPADAPNVEKVANANPTPPANLVAK
ncbi:MAG: hypothetical protein WAN48_11525 [Actinomycetes bacterium]